MEYLKANEIRESGILHEVNRRVLHPIGLAGAVSMEDGSIRIIDYREDPEGVSFDSCDQAKASRFREIEAERKPARVAALGYWVQPCEGVPDES